MVCSLSWLNNSLTPCRRQIGSQLEPATVDRCNQRVSEQVEDRPLAEGQLIESAKKGNHIAYGELVRAHQDIARRVAYLVLRRYDEVDDVVQEAFVKAFRCSRPVSTGRRLSALDPGHRPQRGPQPAARPWSA